MRKVSGRPVMLLLSVLLMVAGVVLAPTATAATGQETLLVNDRCATRLLQQPPFAPTDPGRFTLQAYPSGPSLVPAAAPGLSESRPKAEVALLLTGRFRGDLRKVKAAMAVYDDPVLKAIVPDYRLRLAAVAAQGSAGASLLDALRSGVFERVEFAEIPPIGNLARATAYVHTNPATGRAIITFHVKYQYEDVLLLMVVLSHEVLHQDGPDPIEEELINTYLNITIAVKLYAEAPWLALIKTDLARRLSAGMMAWINTRDASGAHRLFGTGAGTLPTGVYPGGSFLIGFGEAFSLNGESSPGNPTLRAQVKAVTGVDLPEPNFDAATLDLLDTRQVLVSTTEQIVAARLIGLKTGLCKRSEL